MSSTQLLDNMLTANSEILAIGQRAFTAQQRGILTGDWTDFLALVSDDIEFRAPSPHLPNGVIYGKQAVAALLQKFTTELSLSGKITQVKPLTSNQTTVAVEFFAEGRIGSECHSYNLVVFYEIEHGKIKRFQEYIDRI